MNRKTKNNGNMSKQALTPISKVLKNKQYA